MIKQDQATEKKSWRLNHSVRYYVYSVFPRPQLTVSVLSTAIALALKSVSASEESKIGGNPRVGSHIDLLFPIRQTMSIK